MKSRKFPPTNCFCNMHVRACTASSVCTSTWQLLPDTGGPYDVVTSHTRLYRETLHGPTSTRTRLEFIISDCACAHIQKLPRNLEPRKLFLTARPELILFTHSCLLFICFIHPTLSCYSNLSYYSSDYCPLFK